MKFNLAILSLLAGFVAVSAQAATAAVATEQTTQYVYVTNLLDNTADSFVARTQSPVKVDVYQGNKICYTVPNLNFGDQYTLQASPTNPACVYISKLVVTPQKVNGLQVYNAPINIDITGGQVTRTQVTIIQKPGTGNAPVFNDDGTVKPGTGIAQVGMGYIAQ